MTSPPSALTQSSWMTLNLWHVLRLAAEKFIDDDMPTYAAALAYRLLFALFPFLIFLTTLLGVLGIPQLFDWMQTQAAYMVPQSAMDHVNRILSEIQKPNGRLLSLGIVLAMWAASAAARGTINALNIAYDVKERRPTWKRLFLSVTYTAGLALMLLCAAAMMVTGPSVAEWIVHYIGLDAMFAMMWALARWPVTVVLLLVVVSTVYYAAPNVSHPFRFFTPGSLLAVTLWIAASVCFSLYVQNFGKYSETYGSIGAVIVLLFYFYISSAVLLFGGEVNAVIDRLCDRPPKAKA